MVEQSTAHPETLCTPFTCLRPIEFTAVSQQLGTFFYAELDVFRDPGMCSGRNDWAHFSGQVGAIENFQGFGPFQQLWHDLVGHVTNQHRHGNRHATFAG
ncbi:hypothetical protein D9M70_568860 [compost metagenome]